MSSISLLPFLLYSSLTYWIYPLKDYIGDTGCYVAIYGRDIGYYVMQTHSFFMAMFRYNCVFNGTILKKINLSPKVSSCFKPLVNPKQLSWNGLILFFFDGKKLLSKFYNELLYCSQYTLKWFFKEIHPLTFILFLCSEKDKILSASCT